MKFKWYKILKTFSAHGNFSNFKLRGLSNYKFTKFSKPLPYNADFSITWPMLTFQSDYAIDGSFGEGYDPKTYHGTGFFK